MNNHSKHAGQPRGAALLLGPPGSGKTTLADAVAAHQDIATLEAGALLTVQSQRDSTALKTYRLKEKGEPLLTGLSIGQAIGSGPVRVIESPENAGDFEEGDVLVTQMTDPDWVPIMRRAAGIITETGGRTCHAAIVSRELGVPAVVGTGDATHTLKEGQPVTISCAEGDEGYIYDGRLDCEESEVDLEDLPKTRTRILMNIASPSASFRWWRLPCDGIGLARMEFIIGKIVKVARDKKCLIDRPPNLN